MTDQEINRRLALAIGYTRLQISMQTSLGVCAVLHSGYWKEFDYRDWRTIGPIAEKYEAFPFFRQSAFGPLWVTIINGNAYTAAIPQEVIALAVIEEIGGFKIP